MSLRRMPDRRKDSASRSRADDRFVAPIRARRVCSVLTLLCSVVALTISGCSSMSGEKSEMFGLANIRGIRGPLERSMGGDASPLELGRQYTEAERREARQCQDAFDKGDYAQAIKLGKKTAKKFKESSLGEQAQFCVAESYFAQGNYAKAQDGYTQLFADYPSTRYVEPSTRKLFRISQAWLEIAEPMARSEIRRVSGEKVIEEDSQPASSKDPTLFVRILPNFHDRSRPMFDTQGRALESLKSIWMNDPTGPLADDALMLTATYYQRHDNFVEADRYFEILRQEYPDSPHLEEAFLLGAHVKQMSYQGPYYEGRELTGARKLKEQSLQLFPVSQQRQQLRKDLDQIYLLEAQRAWAKIEYYQKKRKPRAIAIACIQLVSDYPDTQFASKARDILRTIDRKQLADLPEVPEFMDSLPPAEPPGTSDEPDRRGPPVKSVSNPRVMDDGEADAGW